MDTSRKKTLLVLALCSLAFFPSTLDAQPTPEGKDESGRYISVNGWDLRQTKSDVPESADSVCTLSLTMLAQPDAGAHGGRVTVRFEKTKSGLITSTVVTGGVDEGRPTEIWVDSHLIADQKSKIGTISFSAKTSASIAMLFKAGRSGAVRFHRNSRVYSVPISLDGFTKAARSFQTLCTTPTV